MQMQAKQSVTVVIATLGGQSLVSTVESLNRGSIPPAEILICIPVEDAGKLANIQHKNIRILKTDFRGQVAQRLFGFKDASHDFVMQLDDDILVDVFCVERLLATLQSLGPKVAVAPALIDQKTGNSVHKKLLENGLLSSIYYWLMNGSDGYAPGRIDKSGSSVGVDPLTSDSTLYDVEWLAGGCILHHKENLVLENFWPLVGKAYYEDVVHSCILNGKCIRLVIDATARCSIELFSQSSFKPKEFVNNLYRDYLGRRYFMRRFSRQSPRIYLYYLTRGLSYLYKRF
jgi:hypothetical protein